MRTAAAFAAAVLALAGCSARDAGSSGSTSAPSSGTSTTTTGATPGADWTIGLDSQPTRVAVDGDRVYVSTAGSARYPPQIYVIEASTGLQVESHTATGQPYDLLVAPDGRLWIAGDRHPDQAVGAGINIHDPASLDVVDHTDLPGQAFSLAQVGDEIWVGSEGSVFVLDPATGDVVRSFDIGGPAYDLVVLPQGDGVIAVEGDRLERLGPDGAPTGAQPVAADGNIVAAATVPTVWVRVPVGSDSTVLAFDPALGTAGEAIGVDPDSAGGGILAAKSGDVVLVDDRSDEVLCLPGGTPPPDSVPATDLVGVLGELPDGRLVFATSAGLAVREISC